MGLTQADAQVDQSVKTMKALVFHVSNQIGIEHVAIPKAGPGEAVIRVTLTTICGTDLHILKGEYPVKTGLIIGHEAVGVIHALVGVTGYRVGAEGSDRGDNPLVGNATIVFVAISPNVVVQLAAGGSGNTINGAQAEYLLVPFAQANLTKSRRPA